MQATSGGMHSGCILYFLPARARRVRLRMSVQLVGSTNHLVKSFSARAREMQKRARREQRAHQWSDMPHESRSTEIIGRSKSSGAWLGSASTEFGASIFRVVCRPLESGWVRHDVFSACISPVLAVYTH